MVELKRNTLRNTLLALSALAALNGCAVVATGAAVVGVNAATDPRTIGSQIDDQTIEMKASAKLGNDDAFEDSRVRVVSYNQNVLLVGQVANESLRQRAEEVIKDTNGIARIFNQLRIGTRAGISTQASDTWISGEVKVRFVSDEQVDATQVEIVTENGEVFLLGMVDAAAADRAVEIARNVSGVTRVIKAFTAPKS